MNGASSSILLLSPADRLLFTLTPEMVRKEFNIDVNTSHFLVGRANKNSIAKPDCIHDTLAIQALTPAHEQLILLDLSTYDQAAFLTMSLKFGLKIYKHNTSNHIYSASFTNDSESFCFGISQSTHTECMHIIQNESTYKRRNQLPAQ
ncbi:hypothetical protein [Marinomonas sp. 2405UD68-3]|uniref:hypothetical protein n=1 Tax=Marinomonas sp. 2405UD68-3 TaxID=3391835 RepID=UPI0039C95F66